MSVVWALGLSLEVLVWLLPWSIMATRFALGFNEPAARLGGMPGRVWRALVVTWAWLLLMPLWLQSGFELWLGAVALLSAPVGALLLVLFVVHGRLSRRRRAGS